MKHDNSINGFHITCFSLLFFFLRGSKSQHGVFCLSHFSLFLPGAISCSRELRVLLQHLHGSRQGTGELGVVFVDLVEGWVRTALLAFFFRFLPTGEGEDIAAQTDKGRDSSVLGGFHPGGLIATCQVAGRPSRLGGGGRGKQETGEEEGCGNGE